MYLSIRDNSGVRPKPTTVLVQLGGRIVIDNLVFFFPVLTFITGKAKGGVGNWWEGACAPFFQEFLERYLNGIALPPLPVDCRRIIDKPKIVKYLRLGPRVHPHVLPYGMMGGCCCSIGGVCRYSSTGPGISAVVWGRGKLALIP